MYFNMPKWSIDIIILAILCTISIVLWRNIFSSKDLKEEIKSNGGEPVSDDYQTRWHIQHMRHDIIAITKILFWMLVIMFISFALIFANYIKNAF